MTHKQLQAIDECANALASISDEGLDQKIQNAIAAHNDLICRQDVPRLSMRKARTVIYEAILVSIMLYNADKSEILERAGITAEDFKMFVNRGDENLKYIE